MAGQLRHFCAFSYNPVSTCMFTSCVRQRTVLLNKSFHTHLARTKVCVLHNYSSPLSKKSLRNCFQNHYHTAETFHDVVRWRQITRTLYGVGCHILSPGLRRASSGLSLGCRWISSGQRKAWQHRNRSVMLYGVALVILVTGFSYAAVPLYAVFCQATGLGGQATKGHDIDLVEDMVPVRGRPILIRFNADTAASMRWNFRPQQIQIKVVPGETALAFYSAVNPTDKPITGISTYNVVPFEAGQYFNKIQCFCFEEQRLNPREQVDMPVFFYIDPEFADDPKMAKIDTITLSYTFFEAKEGLVLPDPFTRPSEVKTLST